jgi:hypothetical protein
VFRSIADALFWTFHPWSPLHIEPGIRAERVRDPNEMPFYEKVNRFVFGPPKQAEDPHAARARVLFEIRQRKGRIGLADVMRITGLPRNEADPLMARLMMDHDGTVNVGAQGGIVYRFEAMRRTAEASGILQSATAPVWSEPPTVPPLTGNTEGANLAIIGLNAFNAVASAWALHRDLTLANLVTLLTTRVPRGAPPIELPNDGIPLVLGAIPLVFSLVLFALPVARALLRNRAQRRADAEKARLAILRAVIERASNHEVVPDQTLRSAYRVATGVEPTSKEITAHVVDLGGDVDVGPEGEVRYRFADLEADALLLEEEREQAPIEEAKLGRIVFASDE